MNIKIKTYKFDFKILKVRIWQNKQLNFADTMRAMQDDIMIDDQSNLWLRDVIVHCSTVCIIRGLVGLGASWRHVSDVTHAACDVNKWSTTVGLLSFKSGFLESKG